MNDQEFVGKFLAFKGEDEYVGEKNVLMQVTDVEDGEVELAFNAPLPGNPRFYIRFNLPLVVGNSLPQPKK